MKVTLRITFILSRISETSNEKISRDYDFQLVSQY